MPATLSPDNPIAWVQVRLRGAWRNLLITGAAYTLLVGGGIFVTTRMTYASPTSAYGGWLVGLLWLQMIVLLLFGSSRVTSAIRGDHTSRMIESHRLMPVGGGQAIFGYLVGSTSQATILGLCNVALGLLVAAGAGFPATSWLVVNVVVAAFCAFIWSMAGLWAFLVRVPFLVLLAPLILVFITQGMVIVVAPAVTVLLSPLVGETIFGMRASSVELTPARGVSLLAQAFVVAICFVGAGRKFRRGDAPALTLPLGLLLLAGWVAISWVGIAWWDQFRPTFVSRHWVETGSQIVGSLLSAMILALIPVAGLARAEWEWRQRSADDPRLARRPLPAAVLAALATLIATALVLVARVENRNDTYDVWRYGAGELPRPTVPWRDLFDPALRTAVVVFLFLLATGYLLRLLGRFRFRPVALFVWLVVTWAGPLLADLIRYTLQDVQQGPVLQTISTLGPPGALVQLWARPTGAPVDTTVGIAVQAAVAVMLAVAWYATQRKGRAAKAGA